VSATDAGGRRRLVGRDAEATIVRDCVAGALRAGRVRAVVIEAVPGMGATALVDVAVTTAAELGLSVVRPVVDAGDIAIGDAPSLLVVDHIDDLDEAAAAALRALVAHGPERPVALVVTTVDADRSPARDIVDAGGTRVRLARLSDEECIELAETDLGGARCGPVLGRCVTRCADGIPVVVVEIVAGLRREGRIAVSDGVADIDRPDLPGSFRDGIIRYVGAPPTAIEALQVGAALADVGGDVELAELALVLGRPVADVAVDLEPAVQRRVVAVDGSRLSFRHPAVTAALHESLVPAVRAAVHGEIASVLHAAGHADGGVVAAHIVAAEGLAPAAVAAEVAWERRRTDPVLALDVCRVTLAAGGIDDATRDRLETASAWPAITQGRIADAASTVRNVLGRRHDPALDVELQWCLVAAMQRAGDAEAARDALVRLVATRDLDDADRRWLMLRLPGAHLFAGDVRAAEDAALELTSQRGASDDPETLLATSTALVFGRLARGAVDSAVALAERAAILRRDARLPEGVGIVLPMALIEADRFDDARAALHDALRREGDPSGDASLLTIYDIWLVIVDVLAGNWDDAVAAADVTWQRTTTNGSAVSVPWALAYPALVHLRRDEIDRADELVRTAEGALERHGAQNGADVVLWARSLIAEARASVADAASLLATEWDLTASVRYFQSWRGVAPDLVRLAVAIGDRDRAAAVTADAEEGARRAPDVASARGAALRCRGLLDGDADALIGACDAFRASPRRPDLMMTAEEAGTMLTTDGARARRRTEGITLLTEARSIAEALGARRVLRRVDSRLSSLGAAPRRIRRDAAASGWESLTAREAEVAALVAEGLTNPQIAERLVVSRHTVESHLKRIFVKLGATSRAQLASEALRRPNT
jgi:DNA-binding CsgD family transcriptional regulator